MNSVISATQARQITRGRTPLVPVVYEQAIKALDECITLDDAKLWDNKADALAAWAKIYHDDKVSRQAKILKLHAYRRMGALASELYPHRRVGGGGGSLPGPKAALQRLGMSATGAGAAIWLGKKTNGEFAKIADAPHIRGPVSMRLMNIRSQRSEGYRIVTDPARVSLYSFARFCEKFPASEIASQLDSRDAEGLKTAIVKAQEWLDELDAMLPKLASVRP